MNFGLSEQEITLLRDLVVDPLKSLGCQVWIFGSRARGTPHPFSDIDLLFQLPSGKSLPSGFLSDIREKAEESRLNYKIDLVDEQDLASSYKANVHQEKILL